MVLHKFSEAVLYGYFGILYYAVTFNKQSTSLSSRRKPSENLKSGNGGKDEHILTGKSARNIWNIIN